MRRTLFVLSLFLLIIFSCSPSYRITGFDEGVRTFITFDVNSAKLSDLERLRLNEFSMDIPAGWHVYIKGSADTRNETNCKVLAMNRYITISNYLTRENYLDPMLIEYTIELDAGYSPEFSRSVILTISKN